MSAGTIKTARITSAVVVIGTAHLACSVGAFTAVAVVVDFTASGKSTPTFVAMLMGGAFSVGGALRDAVAIDATEFEVKTGSVVIAAAGRVADAVGAAPGVAVSVIITTGGIVVGDAITPGGADELATAVFIDGTDLGTGSAATDHLAITFSIDCADIGTVGIGAILVVDVVLTG